MIYIIYEIETGKKICITDEFNHAFTLLYQFNDNKYGRKYDIKKEINEWLKQH